jgi:hypothetical protein
MAIARSMVIRFSLVLFLLMYNMMPCSAEVALTLPLGTFDLLRPGFL